MSKLDPSASLLGPQGRNGRGNSSFLFSCCSASSWPRRRVIGSAAMLLHLLVLFSPPSTTTTTPTRQTTTTSTTRSLPFLASALPTGAASCVGNEAAVGGFHLDDGNGTRTVVSGELAQGGVLLQIDGRTLLPPAPITLNTGVEYALTVSTSQPPGFQGILLRVEYSDDGDGGTDDKKDLSTAITPNFNDLDLQTATVCEPPVGGVTHTNSDPKPEVTAQLRFSFPGTVYLDATLVGLNDAARSVYGYNQFTLTVVGEPATRPPTLPPGVTLPPTVSPPPTFSPTVVDVLGSPSPTYGSSGSRNRTTMTTMMMTMTTTTCAAALILLCAGGGWLL